MGVAVLALLLLAACADSRLPGVARPKPRLVRPAGDDHGDTIRYRALSREDYRATTPPADLGGHAALFGAWSCIKIASDGKPLFVILPDGDGYSARLQPWDFYAEMDRECSWWSAAESKLPEDYKLQHEQVHFAIVEIEARRLSREMLGIEERGRTSQSAAAALNQRIDATARAAMNAVSERFDEFDEDTSGRHSPTLQAEWLSRVDEELERGR